MSEQRKILFVAFQNSIHAARWIDMIADNGWDLHFFPVDEQEPNSSLRGATLHWPFAPAGVSIGPKSPLFEWAIARRACRFAGRAMTDPPEAYRRLRERAPRLVGALRYRINAWAGSKNVVPEPKGLVTPCALRHTMFQPTIDELGGSEALESGCIRLGESNNAAPTLNGPGVLASLIRRLQPDLIHSMEFQHAGYLVLRAKELYGPGFPSWLATNWGSDIHLYQRYADHRAQIERLLGNIDYYSCECARDIGLARSLGYTGKVLPVLPNSGGFHLDRIVPLRSSNPTSKRKLIMVKGYEHFAGRGMVALRVLERFRERLAGYQVVMFSVSAEPRKRAYKLMKAGQLNIKVIDSATHDEILSHFGRARVYLAISISDGVSTSALEAMAMGAFPIQTDTSCCDEWYRDGEGGFIIPPDDFEIICERFARALDDDELVDRAAKVNRTTVEARLDRNLIAPKIRAFYDEMYANDPLADRRA